MIPILLLLAEVFYIPEERATRLNWVLVGSVAAGSLSVGALTESSGEVRNSGTGVGGSRW